MTGKGSSFQKVIDELTSDEGRELSRRTLQEFSDIDPLAAPCRRPARLPPPEAAALEGRSLSGDGYAGLLRRPPILLGDPDPRCGCAPFACWIGQTTPTHPALIRMLADDPDVQTRAQAATARKIRGAWRLEEITDSAAR
jgi:hypothetical protein